MVAWLVSWVVGGTRGKRRTEVKGMDEVCSYCRWAGSWMLEVDETRRDETRGKGTRQEGEAKGIYIIYASRKETRDEGE